MGNSVLLSKNGEQTTGRIDNMDDQVDYTYQIVSALLGVAVGDALGVPVEFLNRITLFENPVTDMTGFGSHHKPAGTFSDDSSLTFCLAEALIKGYDLKEIGENLLRWYKQGYWTADGDLFDIGLTTLKAIKRIENGILPDLAGGMDINDNGNGSLMRILPLVFHLIDKTPEERFEKTRQVSALTHGHCRSVIACYYYLEFARKLLMGKDKFVIYQQLKTEVTEAIQQFTNTHSVIGEFNRLLKSDIFNLSEESIRSSGYVIDTLEASIWCIMTTSDYKAAVLQAVNFGEDTDTTGAVTGGLAGILYGYETIPEPWLNQMVRKIDIIDLGERLGEALLEAR